MKALIIAEHADIAAHLAAGARALANEVAVVTIGSETPIAFTSDAAYHITVPKGAIADDASETIYGLLEDVSVVIAEPTRRMKTVIGRLAASKMTSVITDAVSIQGTMATSLYFGGVGQITREAKGEISCFTASPSTFGDVEPNGACEKAEELDWVSPTHTARLVSSCPLGDAGEDLSKCDVVVGAGRGFSEKSDLDMARDLAAKLNAGLGCSRPLAEGTQWLPAQTYIGVSGLMLSPKVYVALGISGQMQHMVGVNRSDVVFAVNKDENAPIFKQCDYGLVGAIEDVIPALATLL